jgi:hypothetical protein
MVNVNQILCHGATSREGPEEKSVHIYLVFERVGDEMLHSLHQVERRFGEELVACYCRLVIFEDHALCIQGHFASGVYVYKFFRRLLHYWW